MSDQGIEDSSKIPSESKALLLNIIGEPIRQLIRYSWFPLEEIAAKYGVLLAPRDVIFGTPVAPEDAFSLTAGPLALEIGSGEIIAFGSQPSSNSLYVWHEATAKRFISKEPLSTDSELYPLYGSDPLFRGPWRQMEGAVITAISLIKRAPQSVLFEDLPNEVGLRFHLDNGLDFIASHGLHDDPDDFSVITQSQILPEVLPDLTEIDITKI